MKDAFWWSERDGWGHLYRFDAAGMCPVASADGTAARQSRSPATQESAHDGRVADRSDLVRRRDDEAGVFHRRAAATGSCTTRSCIASNYDGTGLTLVTPEDANHVIEFSPSGKYFVDTYSRIENATGDGAARRAATGSVDREARGGGRLAARSSGWSPAQVVLGQGARRRDRHLRRDVSPAEPRFDEEVPDHHHIYPGPQVGQRRGVELQERRRASSRSPSLASSSSSSIIWARRSARRCSTTTTTATSATTASPITSRRSSSSPRGIKFIDLDRVGIFGHSGGGFASTDAMLRYPEFFKVAVSSSGTTTTAATTSTGRRNIRG